MIYLLYSLFSNYCYCIVNTELSTVYSLFKTNSKYNTVKQGFTFYDFNN